jgi:hypothetical protein
MTTEARNGTRVTAVSQTDTWIQVEGGHWLPKQVYGRQFLKPALAIDVDTTTSDLCHAFIKPATLPRGWVDEPELLHNDDEGNDISSRRWYKHIYRRQGATETQSEPPPGTRSMCAELAADPASAHFVGKPTHFLSHAWLYKILNVVGALEEFEASQPEGSPTIFWWFDTFALDEVCRAQRLPSLPIHVVLCLTLSVLFTCCAACDAGAAAGVVVDDIQGCHRDDGPHGDASVTVGWSANARAGVVPVGAPLHGGHGLGVQHPAWADGEGGVP